MLELEPEPEPVMDPNEACWAQRIAVCPSFFMFGQKRKKKRGRKKKEDSFSSQGSGAENNPRY